MYTIFNPNLIALATIALIAYTVASVGGLV